MSIRIGLISLAMVVSLTGALHAQDSLNYSTISFAVGINSIANKDLFQSPYTYKGTNLVVGASYTKFREKGQHIVDFNFSGGHIESVVSPQAKNQLLMLYYDYLFNFKMLAAGKIRPSLGMGLHSMLSNTNYLPEIEGPKSYQSGGAYLTVGGAISYRLNKKSGFNLQLGLPVFGLVYRPDFEINGNTLAEAAFIGKGGLFSAKLEYSYRIAAKLSVTARYTFNYFAFDDPRSIDIMQNALSIGLRKVF